MMEDQLEDRFGGTSREQRAGGSNQQGQPRRPEEEAGQEKGSVGRGDPKHLVVLQDDSESRHRRNPFRLAYGVDVMIPFEIQMSSLRLENFDEDKNSEGLRLCVVLRD